MEQILVMTEEDSASYAVQQNVSTPLHPLIHSQPTLNMSLVGDCCQTSVLHSLYVKFFTVTCYIHAPFALILEIL